MPAAPRGLQLERKRPIDGCHHRCDQVVTDGQVLRQAPQDAAPIRPAGRSPRLPRAARSPPGCHLVVHRRHPGKTPGPCGPRPDSVRAVSRTLQPSFSRTSGTSTAASRSNCGSGLNPSSTSAGLASTLSIQPLRMIASPVRSAILDPGIPSFTLRADRSSAVQALRSHPIQPGYFFGIDSGPAGRAAGRQ